MFGSNQHEVGSLLENLILNTAGKIKIRIGLKFIDLLNSKGELNITLPKIIKTIKSEGEIKLNGFYYLDNVIYAYIDGIKLPIMDEPLISILNSELEIPKEDNIALVYKDKKWNYIEVVSKEDYIQLEITINKLKHEIEQLKDLIK